MRSLRVSRCVLAFVSVSLLLVFDAILEPVNMRAQGAHWAASYGGGDNDVAWTLNPTSDGGCAVAGWTRSFGAGARDFWVLKLRPDGTVQWQRSYGGYGEDAADLVYPTSDGGYAVTGHAASFGGLDAWVLKLDENGAIQWQKTYGGRGYDEAHAMRQTLDGGYVVAGFTDSFGSEDDWDVWILKLDQSGAVLWQKTLGGPRIDVTWSVHETSDGGSVVTGSTSSFGAGGDDLWLLKLSQDGAVQWQKTYGGQGGDAGESVRQTSDGGYWVGGVTGSFGAGARDLWVLRLDPQGSIPGCNLGAGSNATIRDTAVTAVDCSAIVSNSRATVRDTHVGAVTSTGRVSFQCRYEPTPTPTQTAVPTATRTATPTMTCTPTAVYRIYLPIVMKR